jgi:glycosyltransferase involved in cell wall biosynthesis
MSASPIVPPAPSGTAGVSVIIITRDEEADIAACLASVDFARERIVVDSGSTDATVRIARAAGAVVHETADWPGFGPQKNRALAQATQPWVLSIDADERVTPELRSEILRVVQAGEGGCEVWDMPRRSSFCGQYMLHSGWYPDRVTRLFRRGAARFSDDLVHERLVSDRPLGHLRSDLLHATYPDLETALDKLDRYSTAAARGMAQGGRRASLGGAVIRGLWAFFRTYVLRLGFLDGRLGFVLAVTVAEGTYYKYLKLWLLGRGAAAAAAPVAGPPQTP